MTEKGPSQNLQAILAARGERRVWLRVRIVLDGVATTPLRDVHVVYDNRKILFVGGEPPARLLRPGQWKPDAHLPNYTALPGLIEAHAHLFLEGGELDLPKRSAYLKQTSDGLLAAARRRLEKLVQLGVMAVRDAGDKDGVGLALSRLYMSAKRPLMPYVDSPGAAIYHKGRYGSFMGEAMEDCPSPYACVESRVNAGADRIKLIPTGIINFKKGAVTTDPQMTTQEASELVTAAQSFSKQTFAHASGDTGIDRAIDGGVDSVEHGFFIRDDQLARMRDRQIAWVPTFAPVQAQLEHCFQSPKDSRPTRSELGESAQFGRHNHRWKRRGFLWCAARPWISLRTGAYGKSRSFSDDRDQQCHRSQLRSVGLQGTFRKDRARIPQPFHPDPTLAAGTPLKPQKGEMRHLRWRGVANKRGP